MTDIYKESIYTRIGSFSNRQFISVVQNENLRGLVMDYETIIITEIINELYNINRDIFTYEIQNIIFKLDSYIDEEVKSEILYSEHHLKYII